MLIPLHKERAVRSWTLHSQPSEFIFVKLEHPHRVKEAACSLCSLSLDHFIFLLRLGQTPGCCEWPELPWCPWSSTSLQLSLEQWAAGTYCSSLPFCSCGSLSSGWGCWRGWSSWQCGSNTNCCCLWCRCCQHWFASRTGTAGKWCLVALGWARTGHWDENKRERE